MRKYLNVENDWQTNGEQVDNIRFPLLTEIEVLIEIRKLYLKKNNKQLTKRGLI